jgi:hypothetical protein
MSNERKWWVVETVEEYAEEAGLDLAELVNRLDQSAPPMTDEIITFEPDDVFQITREDGQWTVSLVSGPNLGRFTFDFVVLAKMAQCFGSCV